MSECYAEKRIPDCDAECVPLIPDGDAEYNPQLLGSSYITKNIPFDEGKEDCYSTPEDRLAYLDET